MGHAHPRFSPVINGRFSLCSFANIFSPDSFFPGQIRGNASLQRDPFPHFSRNGFFFWGGGLFGETPPTLILRSPGP